MENLINAYTAVGIATIVVAVKSILLPSLKEIKPPAFIGTLYSTLFVVVMSILFPLLIYAVLFQPKESRQATKEGIRRVMYEN